MKKRFLSIILAVVMFSALVIPAYAAGETVTTSMSGNNVTITIKDGSAVKASKVVTFAKNTTQIYEVGNYTVQIEYNGSGVKTSKILSHNLPDPVPETPPPQPTPAPIEPETPPPQPTPAPIEPETPKPDTNAPAPKPGAAVSGAEMTWNASDKQAAKAFTQSSSKDKTPPKTALIPVPSVTKDTISDKITSNAHSGDYPGIYFYWNDKQKDDGILKVDPDIFEIFKDGKFYITAKNSNAYWDYWIYDNDDNAVVTSEGFRLYQIPRYFMYTQSNKNGNGAEVKDELKNINMIFIGGNYKDAWLTINKEWFDEDGEPITDEALIEELNKLLSFNGGKLTLGLNKIEITDYISAFFGKKVTVTEGSIKKYAARKNPLYATVKWDDEEIKIITFENQKQKAEITIKKIWDLVAGSKAPGATFHWGVGDVETDDYFVAKAGDKIIVKEGTYWFKELPIDGFTVKEGFKVITVEAGGKYTVSFENKEDRAYLNIIKVWTGDPRPSGASPKLTNGYKFGGPSAVKAGTNVKFDEVPMSEMTPGDGYRYVFKKVGMEVSAGGAAPEAVDEIDFIAEKDVDYVVYITNEVTKIPLPATLTIVKVWQDDSGRTLNKNGTFANVDKDIKFTAPFVLGKNEEVEFGLDLSTITEDISDCVYADEYNDYTFRQVSVSGNKGIVAPGGKYTITFTNRLVKTPRLSSYEVSKVWTGAEIPEKLLPTPTFNPTTILNREYVVNAGSTVSITERPIGRVTDDLYTYEFELEKIEVDGVVVNAVNFRTAAEQHYKIVFYNKVTAIPRPSSYTVQKLWTGASIPTSLRPSPTFSPAVTLNNRYTVNANTNVAISENDLDPVQDALNIYTFELERITVDGVTVQEVDFNTVAEKNHVIVFTNRVTATPRPSSYTVRKQWTGDSIPAGLLPTPTFSPATILNNTYAVNAGTRVRITENNIGQVQDDLFIYTFKLEKITVDGAEVSTVDFSTVAEKDHVIIFYNKVTATPRTSSYTVQKQWTGDSIPANIRPIPTFTPAVTLNISNSVNAGTSVAITENAISQVQDNLFIYTFALERITVDGVEVKSVDFKTVANKDHVIVFYNKVTATPRSSSYTVQKQWTGDSIPANLLPSPTFSPTIILGNKYTANAGTRVAITENALAQTEDYFYTYTFALEKITVDGVTVAAVNFSTEADANHVIIFYNKVTATRIYHDPSIRVVKAWVDDNGAPIPESASLIKRYFDAGGFVNFIDNANIPRSPGETWTVGHDSQVSLQELYNNGTISISETPRESVRTNLMSITVKDKKGSIVYEIESGDDSPLDIDTVIFKALDDESYVVTFTNRIVLIDYPTKGTGYVYKGAEKEKDTPKNSLNDSVDDSRYFSGGSDDTVYLYISWYDSDGNKQLTEYWGHFKAGGNRYKDFYVYEEKLGGYFYFVLDHGNRTTDRDGLSSDQGKWYSRVVLGNNLQYQGFFPGPTPTGR